MPNTTTIPNIEWRLIKNFKQAQNKPIPQSITNVIINEKVLSTCDKGVDCYEQQKQLLIFTNFWTYSN